jgi:3-keto-5-aminohexanoate cleavage enzyme
VIAPLPRIMVAPNGARRGKADHPALPVTIPGIVATAAACHAAGAGGLHAHVRDAEGRHVLDAGLYRELIAEMARKVPGMAVQITTEAIGLYGAPFQRQLVYELRPAMVSVALAEMLSDGDEAEAMHFYRSCADAGIAVQHILYSPDEVRRLSALVESGVVPSQGLQILHVLGRYSAGQMSRPADLDAPLSAAADLPGDWAVCAFGPGETACLARAARLGGKVRVGFENSLWNADGTLARDNAQRVAEVAAAIAMPQDR